MKQVTTNYNIFDVFLFELLIEPFSPIHSNIMPKIGILMYSYVDIANETHTLRVKLDMTGH